FCQAEDGIRDFHVTGVQTCALPILQGRLHVALEEGQAQSCYRFPEVGELRFVRDADASDALVMLASLVGKYMRELLMHRVAHFRSEERRVGKSVDRGGRCTIHTNKI